MEEENKLSTQLEFSSDDFTLVQENTKIFDQKFETKPTTFFKDAIKRFRKNKSSVIGAFILGAILLLSLIVPVVSKADINTINRDQAYLQPKLFNVNENHPGFWDGTKKHTHLIYDIENEVPAGYYKEAVLDLHVDAEPTLIDQPIPSAHGGSLMFVNELKDGVKTASLSSPKANFSASANCKVNVSLSDEDDLKDSKLGEYRIMLIDADSSNSYTLKDWSNDYSDFTIDISSVLSSNLIDELYGQFSFEIKQNGNPDVYTYLLIESVIFTCDESYGDYENLTNNLSFDNPSRLALKTLTENPESYWVGNGRKNVRNVEVYYCDFRYDTYLAVYHKDNVVYAISDLNKLKDAGYCTFDTSLLKYDALTDQVSGIEEFYESFEILDSKNCPIDGFNDIKLNPVTHKVTTVTCEAYRYRAMGYTKMPKFTFGTDQNGQDLFTKCFFGLRQSFALALIIASFCFIFGLVWGSISGYFGGYTDLFMERFCDILGRVPDLLIISLLTIHMGSGFLTFIIALIMTGWMGTAGLTRTQFYRFKGREYVLASRTLGSSDTRLIFKHILPNSMGTIITSSVFMITSVIRSEASFAYLHIGLDSSNSFGVILSNNQGYIATFPYLIVMPSVVMALMMISFNLFGNGLRDAMNPSLKGSE